MMPKLVFQNSFQFTIHKVCPFEQIFYIFFIVLRSGMCVSKRSADAMSHPRYASIAYQI